MGYYVNPLHGSKENWLKVHGTAVKSNRIKWDEVPEGTLPIVLIDNGFFTAAGVAYDEKELSAFLDPNDYRPKQLFLVRIEDLVDVVPGLDKMLARQ